MKEIKCTQFSTLETPKLLSFIVLYKLQLKYQQKLEQLGDFVVLELIKNHSLWIKCLTTWAKTRLYYSFKCVTMLENHYIKFQYNCIDGIKQILIIYSFKINNNNKKNLLTMNTIVQIWFYNILQKIQNDFIGINLETLIRI